MQYNKVISIKMKNIVLVKLLIVWNASNFKISNLVWGGGVECLWYASWTELKRPVQSDRDKSQNQS
jgi:hypothetical protein